jgi:hypothetical protein
MRAGVESRSRVSQRTANCSKKVGGPLGFLFDNHRGRCIEILWAVAALLIALTGLGLGAAQDAAGQGRTRTGNEMLPACRAFLEGPRLNEHATTEEALRAGFCAGYVAGIIEESTEACVPAISSREAVHTVVEFLETHSEQLNDDFEELVEDALRATWPCPAQQP